MFGFLYRATLGSAMQAARGRLSFHKLLKNWGAAARLPLMHLGLAKDIWYEFDRYLELEKGKPSTFFVIPFEGTPGQSANGKAPQIRATRYDVSHLREKIPSLLAAGCEVGLHGIDAWADASRGRVEAQRIAEFTGKSEVGVRMHWLYRDEHTPGKLDAAGFPYDSTAGYNETVGYWAGTAQVFRPLGNQQTLELPLHVMDTALFNRDRLGLTSAEAWNEVSPILANAGRHGGTFTVNWHDRSIAPERLWDDFHRDLVEKLEKKGPWFSTASQAVQWFRKRRSTKFEQIRSEDDGAAGRIATSGGDSLPGLRLRRHQARPSLAAASVFTETTPNDNGEFHLGK